MYVCTASKIIKICKLSKFLAKQNKILAAALSLFNEHGIEVTGIREIADAVDMLPGNLTYYFRTKDDIVLELVKQLGARNSELYHGTKVTSFGDMAGLYEKSFANNYHYRCLMRSQVVMSPLYPEVQSFYKKHAKHRYRNQEELLHSLIEAGSLKEGLEEDTLTRLVRSISITARMWLLEAWANQKDPSRPRVRRHYIGLALFQLKPYATPKGAVELDELLKVYKPYPL